MHIPLFFSWVVDSINVFLYYRLKVRCIVVGLHECPIEIDCMTVTRACSYVLLRLYAKHILVKLCFLPNTDLCQQCGSSGP